MEKGGNQQKFPSPPNPEVSKVPPVSKDSAGPESLPKKDSREDLDTTDSSAAPEPSETVVGLNETEHEQNPEQHPSSALHTRAAVVPTLPVVQEMRLAPSVVSLGSLPSSCFELSSSNLDLHKYVVLPVELLFSWEGLGFIGHCCIQLNSRLVSHLESWVSNLLGRRMELVESLMN